ncbi:uncharacterized protein LOC143914388 [Arctopsyche grandis]|uniref:uncharacterized protein LOC143914388 n=1 Tax=Arctopsyche grandis TaxID=121162 RepID=UPI00406D9AAA
MARTKKAPPVPTKSVTKTAMKAPRPLMGSGKKNRKKRRVQSFATHIYRVLKQVHEQTGISRSAMSIMNSFVQDLFERIATEAGRLTTIRQRHTLSTREIQTAVRLLLPGELCKHAISEAQKAMVNFHRSSEVVNSDTSIVSSSQ